MTSFALAHSEIAHERVDAEVIAINLRTGAYFSLLGTAADGWDLLHAGSDVSTAADVLAERYGVDRARVEADLGPFAASLVQEELLAPAQESAVRAVELPPLPADSTYRPPTLEKYDDMEELLLLDPIHEVDEAGWPVMATEPREA